MPNLGLTDHQHLLDLTEIDLVVEFLFMLERTYLGSNLLTKQILPDDIEGIFIEIKLRKTKWLLFAGYRKYHSRQNIS